MDSITNLPRIYFNLIFLYKESYRIHGLSRSITCDRDPRFTSIFWKSLFTRLQTKLNISSAYHPQIDGHTEHTHRNINKSYVRLYINNILIGLTIYLLQNSRIIILNMHLLPFLLSKLFIWLITNRNIRGDKHYPIINRKQFINSFLLYIMRLKCFRDFKLFIYK